MNQLQAIEMRQIIIVTGGMVFAFIAGSVNVVGILSVTHSALSHMTGAVSNLAVAGVQANDYLLYRMAVVLSFFLLGAIVSGFVTGGIRFSFRRRYGFLFFAEGIVLFIAAQLFQHNKPVAAEGLCSLVCGIQNGMVTLISGAIVRTTHLTGIITDIGTMIGHTLRGGSMDLSRLILHIGIISGFFTGATFAAMLFNEFQYRILEWLAFLLMVGGFLYISVRRYRLQSK